MVKLGDEANGLFATVVAPGEILSLNTTDQNRAIDGAAIPAHGIARDRRR